MTRRETLRELEESIRRAQELVDLLRQELVTELEKMDEEEEKKELEKMVSKHLRKYGIPIKSKGAQYLQVAIVEAVEDAEVLDGITKILYPQIAKRYKTTASRVEQSIRHTIHSTFSNPEAKISEEFTQRPSNLQFIMTVANDIRIGI